MMAQGRGGRADSGSGKISDLSSRGSSCPSSSTWAFVPDSPTGGSGPTRLQIEEMLLVSGPSAVGKSSFIRRFLDGSLPAELRDMLPTRQGWKLLEAKQLNSRLRYLGNRDATPSVPRLILHYDVVRTFNLGIA